MDVPAFLSIQMSEAGPGGVACCWFPRACVRLGCELFRIFDRPLTDPAVCLQMQIDAGTGDCVAHAEVSL